MVKNLLEIITKRWSQTFYKPIDFEYATNIVGESISSITMWNNVNQLGKHDFSCESVVNNLKEGKSFSDQMNRNCFDLILVRSDWNCSTMENLRCLNSAVDETI